MSNNQLLQTIIGLVRGEISGIHTSAPGKIISYEKGRAVVQPAIKYKVADGRVLDAPLIVNVPVYFLGCEGRSITFPVKVGDPCWLMFAERSIDDWLLGGESDDPRKFDLTDCSAFVGMQQSRTHANDAIEINHGTCKVRIPENGPVSINTDLIIGGISFLSHVHGGVDPGGGTTSTPSD